MPGISLRIHSRPIATMSSTRRKDHRQQYHGVHSLLYDAAGAGLFPELLKKAGVSTAVCAHVGMARGLVTHTEMAHLLFHRKDGLFMVLPFLAGRAPSEAAPEKDDHGRYRKGDV